MKKFPRSLLALAAAAALSGGLASCSALDAVTGGGADKPTNPDATRVHESELKAGDCMAVDFTTGDGYTEIIDCALPHYSEVFHVFDIPGDEFPATMAADAEAGCVAAFTDFIGLTTDESDLSLHWLEPTQATWAEGDRAVVCQVSEPYTDPNVGSLAGAAR